MSDEILQILKDARDKLLANHQRDLERIDSLILQANSGDFAQTSAPTIPRTPKPNLNNLRVADAVRTYLVWADANGIKVNMGDLECELANWEVRTSRGELLRETSNPWKTLSNVLGSPKNADFFRIHKVRRNISRSDIVELATQQRQVIAG